MFKKNQESISDMEWLFGDSDDREGKKKNFLAKLLYRDWKKFALNIILYILQSAPVWVLPIITSDVINLITEKPDGFTTRLLIDAILIIFLLLQNIPVTVWRLSRLNKWVRSTIKNNVEALEKYFEYWEDRHLTLNGLYWSIDDREGTEFTISGTTPEIKSLRGFRPLLNSCMYGDAVSLAKIFALVHNTEKQKHYEEKARGIKEKINKKMWDGEFFKAIHPLDQDLDKEIDYTNIPNELNARELMGYIPWAFCVPTQGREKAFAFLKDSKVFQGKTGFTTADISHPRFLYSPEHSVCMWNGHVWPYATSYVVNAVIALLNEYRQSVLTNEDLYAFIKTYAEMHRSYEDGKWIRFIDEEMFPFEYKWRVREMAKQGRKIMGGQNRGKDYNHSTFIDLVLKGLCGIASRGNELVVEPKIQGIWKWFKIENLTVRKQTYTVYYDEDGNVFNKGKGVIVEKQLD